MILSRRKLGSLLLRALAVRCFPAARAKTDSISFDVDRLLVEHPYETVTEQYRGYRSDATVSLMGITIFSRPGVGSGFASYREARGGDVTLSNFRFGAGSFPKRAHNLNRLGVIHEVVLAANGRPQEAAYFGFMTASPEDGVAESQRALNRNSRTIPYVAADGYISPSQFRGRVHHFTFSSDLAWEDRKSLLRQVRSEFYNSAPESINIDLQDGRWPGTFLHEMALAIRNHPGHCDERYVYNGKQFRVTLDKSSDPKTAESFAQKGLSNRPEAVSIFRGVIHKLGSSKTTVFRMWIEEDGTSILPLRIELQARSFLSLAFEVDPRLESQKEMQDA